MLNQRNQILEVSMAAEAPFHILVEAVPAGIYLTDPQGDCTYVNPYWSAMTGLSREEAAGQGWVRGLHPDDRARVAAQWYKAVGSAEPWAMDYRFQTPEGKVTWVSGRAVALRDQAGRITSYLGINMDITAEREAQQALAVSEARYRRIVEAANVGIWQIDVDHRTALVNPVMGEMLGYTEAEMLGHPLTDFVHPDDLEDHYRRMTQRQQGHNDRYERRFVRKDGSVCQTQVSATALHDATGNFAGAFAMCIDVTELRRSIEELVLLNRAGRAFNSSLDLDEVLSSVLRETRQLLNVTATSMWLHDDETGDLICHEAIGLHGERIHGMHIPAGQGITGHTAMTAQSQIVGDMWSDPRHYDAVTASSQLPMHALLSVPVIGKQGVLGVIVAVDSRADRFTDADRRLIESLATTAALAIENARLYVQTQQEAQLKSQLLREINHRTANTLNIIQSLIEFEQYHAPLADATAYTRFGNAMRQRVQGFAEIHKLLASLTQWGPLPVVALIQMLSDGVTRSLPDGRIVIETRCVDAMIAPRQAGYLALVLNELLTNALKYALPTQGTLHIEIEGLTGAEQLHIRFRDNGPGYPRAVLQGTRVDVGLHLIRTFVEQQLGGTLHLSNTPGATADLQFPIQE